MEKAREAEEARPLLSKPPFSLNWDTVFLSRKKSGGGGGAPLSKASSPRGACVGMVCLWKDFHIKGPKYSKHIRTIRIGYIICRAQWKMEMRGPLFNIKNVKMATTEH